MTWNIAAECISLVILCIIWIYSRKSSSLPTLKNRLFQGCFMATFFAMSTNVLSTLMIQSYQNIPLFLTWFVTTVYFILTPLMGMIYFLYSVSIVYENSSKLKGIMISGSALGILYTILVLANPITKSIFDLNLQDGYVKGPLIFSTYIIFYIYCSSSIIFALMRRKHVERHIWQILGVFPVIAILVIFVQQLYPNVILTGSAATCALLILYLHLQNRQISMDYLTDVPNRLVLLNTVEFMMRRTPEQHFTIIILSLRNFKQINSTYGQQSGDIFLRDICRYLCSITDTGLVYRFKGDEFAILVKNDDESIIIPLLNQIRDRMLSPWQAKDLQCTIPYVIGITSYPSTASTFEDIINALEYSVSKAKLGKEGTICYCDKHMFSELQRKETIIHILKKTVNDKSFELYYQPIYVIKSGKFQFAESLMRLNHTSIGPLFPSEFIPIAEETGLIVELTYQILDKACKFVNQVLSAGIDLRAVHVNLSAVQFKQPDLAERILEIINQNHTPISAIKLEFTESTIAENPKFVIDFMDEMKEHGIRIGLDDFGTGYSNIATVLQMPFNTIKLDKSLLWAAIEKEKPDIAVRSLIHTFRALGMTVVSEGVENEVQKDYVIKNGIDQIQGFYFAKPMSESDTITFLQKNAV